MTPSSRRRKRTWALAIVVLLALLNLGALAWFQLRTSETAPGPGGLAATSPSVAPRAAHSPPDEAAMEHQRQLVEAQQTRIRDIFRDADSLPGPGTVTHSADAVPTLLVPPRTAPYSLPELAQAAPTAVRLLPDGSAELLNHLLLGRGATLEVDSAITPRVLLHSGADGFATLATTYGALNLHGTAGKPLEITSADAAGAPDADTSDGRAYITAQGGRIDARYLMMHDLGFYTGETSGLSWMNRSGTPATGGASDSTFQHNYMGAYTSGAINLVFERVKFLDNIDYGFDPHTSTDHMLLADSYAAGNGSHGIILSRACNNNVVRDTVSERNAGVGIMIDDGEDTGGYALQGSNNNLLQRVRVAGNGAAGVVVEGGDGNRLEDADIGDERYGVWLRNKPTNTVVDTSKLTSQGVGLRVDQESAGTSMTRSTVTAATVGVLLDHTAGTTLTDDALNVAAGTAAAVQGSPTQATFQGVRLTGSGTAFTVDDAATEPPAGVDTAGWSHGASSTSSRGGFSLMRVLGWVPWVLVLLPILLAWPLFRLRRKARLRPPGRSADRGGDDVQRV